MPPHAPVSSPDPYDAVPYHGRPVAAMHPDRLAVASLWQGGPRLGDGPYRIAELGCGDGANLTALAFYHPASSFVGVDRSAGEIERARETAGRLGLDNVRFRQLDVRAFAAGELGTCGLVMAHGVYSWVGEDVREALWSALEDALGPSGLACVSYNAEPGWRTRRLVCEALLRSSRVQGAAAHRRPELAAELADDWLLALPVGTAHTALLAEELEHVRSGDAFYVAHEYLAETNDGFWLRDVVARARAHGLDYVGDAQSGRWEGYVPAEVRDRAAATASDRIEREEIVDLLCNRSFRASLFCRPEAQRIRRPPGALLGEAQIASPVVCSTEPLDPTDAVSQHFDGSGGDAAPRITLEHDVTKAAAAELACRWPQGFSLDGLLTAALRRLAAHGYAVAPSPRRRLVDDLAALYEAGHELSHAVRPQRATAPRAHRLVRDQARLGVPLTTPYHLSISPPREMRLVVLDLDGSRRITDIRAAHGSPLVDQTLDVLGRWGLLDADARPARA